MVIVDVANIPSKDAITDVPMDNLAIVYKTCQELQELCDSQKGIGISAVQVGVPWRLFLVKGDGTCPFITKGKFGYFVNCDYEPVNEEDKVASLEGCLSLRNAEGQLRSFQVSRFKTVKVVGYRLRTEDVLSFEPVDYTLSCLQEGVVFQHEIDHNYGHDRLISTIGKELFVW